MSSLERGGERAGERRSARQGFGGQDQIQAVPGSSPRSPGATAPAAALQLQRTAGNAATSRRLGTWRAVGPGSSPGIVSRPEGPDEREADRVSLAVMERLRAPAGPPLDLADARRGAARSPGSPLIQRAATRAAGGRTPLAGAVDAARGGGAPLASGVRPRFERAFDVDFADVRIHTDAAADRLNDSLSALAFTSGRDIFFSENAYDPTSRRGQALLSHELTHVVQQRLGGTSDAPVIQRQWQDGRGKRIWSQLIHGLLWMHDPATGEYWYYVEGTDIPGNERSFAFEHDGEKLSLQAWGQLLGPNPPIQMPAPDVPQQNNAPQVQNNAPQVQNNAPQVQNNAPQVQNNAPQVQNNAPQNELQLALQALQTLPNDEEWTLRHLTRALVGGNLQGVCNALTVAWLTNKIKPTKVKMGLTSANFRRVYYLKRVLDFIPEQTDVFDSYAVTAHFLDYAAELAHDWFGTLSAQTWTARAQHFWTWLNDNSDRINADPEDKIGTTTKLPLYADKAINAFKLQDMATRVNRHVIDYAKAHNNYCRGYFSLYEGIAGTLTGSGHQYAFSYDHQIGRLMIYDQNAATSSQITRAPGKTLATYFKGLYIDVPFHFSGSDADQFSLDMFLRVATRPR